MGYEKIVKTYFGVKLVKLVNGQLIEMIPSKCASELYSIIICMYIRNHSS